MERRIEYYKKDNLSFSYDRKDEGYWLGIAGQEFFIDSRTYQNISQLKGLDLMRKIKEYKNFISSVLKSKDIKPPQLENMFLQAKRKEEQEFRK